VRGLVVRQRLPGGSRRNSRSRMDLVREADMVEGYCNRSSCQCSSTLRQCGLAKVGQGRRSTVRRQVLPPGRQSSARSCSCKRQAHMESSVILWFGCLTRNHAVSRPSATLYFITSAITHMQSSATATAAVFIASKALRTRCAFACTRTSRQDFNCNCFLIVC
jgi:hypothetical protein